MELQAIHHVAVIVSDYRKSRHFYVDLLGFEVIRENFRKERGDYKLDLRLGDCELEIFGIPDSPPRPSYPEACGLRHLAFRGGEHRGNHRMAQWTGDRHGAGADG